MEFIRDAPLTNSSSEIAESAWSTDEEESEEKDDDVGDEEMNVNSFGALGDSRTAEETAACVAVEVTAKEGGGGVEVVAEVTAEKVAVAGLEVSGAEVLVTRSGAESVPVALPTSDCNRVVPFCCPGFSSFHCRAFTGGEKGNEEVNFWLYGKTNISENSSKRLKQYPKTTDAL